LLVGGGCEHEEDRMSDAFERVALAVERDHADKSVATRRKFVGGTAAMLGSMGLLGAMPGIAKAAGSSANSTANILTVATSAEVLATIVNTVGFQKHLGGDPVTQRNIRAAAREELIHYEVLVSVGGKAVATKIWIPDAVFANRTNFLNTLQVGDQIFVNAYLIGTEAFAHRGQSQLAITAAQFMGVEGVHRALARQSLGLLGNDRVFMKEDGKETAPGAPNRGQRGFEHILDAVAQLEAAGFGFGTKGAKPGQFYDFNQVRKHTPNDPDLNTFLPDLATG
jgi:hypothetical protein